MKLNYPMRYLVTALLVGLAGWFWYHDGVSRGLDLRGGASLTYKLELETLPPNAREGAIQNTVQVIEERINNLGLKDVKVDALPPDQFEVQFPGQESRDVERIKGILTQLGQLEFRMVAEPGSVRGEAEGSMEAKERARKQRMGDAYDGPPIGYRWVPARPVRNAEGQEIPGGPDRLIEIPEAQAKAEVDRIAKLLEDPAVASDADKKAEAERQLEAAKERLAEVEKKEVFSGKDLDPGALGIAPDPQGAGWIVQFAMRDSRRQDFADFTEENLKRQMGIIIDGKIESAPVIQSVLSGNSQISGGGMGGFKKQEAQDLVTVLRSGSLDVGITLQSEFAIGPSLGEASIRRGLYATAIGLALVVVFMILMYLFPGFVAILALIMNLVLIMGLLAFFQAELSLPGIAGVILTVGMAVDANILVFERIREERELGKSLTQAVKAGYERAFVTIVDANVTTLFVAAVLWFMTTGQVKGFAATLAFGILSSMFTALYVTRTIFGWLIEKGALKEMKIPNVWGGFNLSYMKIRLPAIGISLLLIIGGFFAFEEVGQEKYDIEFLAGQRVVMDLEKPLSIKQVKETIRTKYPDAAVVSIKSQKAEESALDLSTESDSFQITIGNVETAEQREEVLSFLDGQFGKDLVPEGLVPVAAPDLPEGTHRYRLSFSNPITEAEVLKILGETEGVTNPKMVSLDGRIATVDFDTTLADEVFHEHLNRAIDANERTLTEPFPMKSFVDPKTAQQHRDDALEAVILSLIFQIIYIYFRFHGASYGFAAVIALIHDVCITLGAIAVCNHFGLVNVKISLAIIAAILTLIGYSMNDTIVVFDRIRENLGRSKMNLSEIIDLSVNQTMSRSLKTSGTTLLVVLVLFIVNYGQASSVLEGFSFVLIVGIITGTYSSIFVASPMLLFLPWHYIRGQQGNRFWILVGVSILGLLVMLFATTTTTMWIAGALIAAYPIYFFAELFRWLALPDPDRALNTVLRTRAA